MKNKEIAGLSDQELIEKIKEEQAGLNKMTLNHAVSPVENPAKIRLNRRNIARLNTEVNKRKKAAK
ncbi:MAG: ribosomal protein [Bacteroidetes bacterium]|jgi:large subunit ribosomal protein L29|nr:ribosomal protein [Bacteroidota bacterium]